MMKTELKDSKLEKQCYDSFFVVIEVLEKMEKKT